MALRLHGLFSTMGDSLAKAHSWHIRGPPSPESSVAWDTVGGAREHLCVLAGAATVKPESQDFPLLALPLIFFFSSDSGKQHLP